jgi:hypothetical protein
MYMAVTIRYPLINDVEAIAALHMAAWQQAYVEMVQVRS